MPNIIIFQKYFIIPLAYLFFGTFSGHGQTVILKGKVSDSLANPLTNANILAVPNSQDASMAFAITDANGLYSLKIESKESYQVSVSYLGFQKQIKTIDIDENSIENFILKENIGQLEEVFLKSKIPLVVKKDTLIYNVDAFATGTERKLNELLKNLPGVEVDREGNVKVQGRKITKVLVENQTFFTGDSKLAVNNIPADAVSQVEVLDNYTEIAMLKGLLDSDAIALNIKLKEDKKKFTFGDIEAGGGLKNRYVVNPKLFYYSPNTSVGFIGDVNNISEKAFTLNDYINFEGGTSKLFSGENSFSTLYNSDISQYISNRDYTENVSQFGALNLQQFLSRSTNLNGYVIASKSKTTTSSRTLNRYSNSEDPFDEQRLTDNSNNNFFIIGKANLEYKPSFEEDFSYSSYFKGSTNNSDGSIITENPFKDNLIQTNSKLHSIQLTQQLNYSLKLSSRHTATIEGIYNFNENKPNNGWRTDAPILQGLLPLVDDNDYYLLQNKRIASHTFNGLIKDYWVVGKFHHLYPSFGVNASFSSYLSEDSQLLSDGNSNSFSDNGFDNKLQYNIVNTFLGLEYKFQTGKVTFKPALYLHFFNWTTNQKDVKKNQSQDLLLPKLDIDIPFSFVEKLTFNYSLENRVPQTSQLANGYILSDFNSVYKGNDALENEIFHNITLGYNKFSLSSKLQLALFANYERKEKHVKNTTILNGIEQYNDVVLLDNPEQNFSFNGSVYKDIGKMKYFVKSNLNYSDFFQLLNEEESLNISRRIGGTIGFKTLFDSFPTLEIGYTKDFDNYKSADGITNFQNDQIFSTVDAVLLKDFIVNADYTLSKNKNKSSGASSVFDQLNASVFYQKEDSPWGFELNASNLLNTKFKQNNFFSEFVITDTRKFTFPRTILFKIQYKL
ncbi:TonB-dependent receptor [Aequorivita marina]|uniref:TonB-dependent receptor n=1 Tax=Aequorivita marina TaxID=3073654 RepID=UPI002875DED8|nr:TonB-dependent receptor [Aequorivita sp. S2608]MDS1297105.1 TonB-dependent receptor [Aequorivita sp. S2608]